MDRISLRFYWKRFEQDKAFFLDMNPASSGYLLEDMITEIPLGRPARYNEVLQERQILLEGVDAVLRSEMEIFRWKAVRGFGLISSSIVQLSSNYDKSRFQIQTIAFREVLVSCIDFMTQPGDKHLVKNINVNFDRAQTVCTLFVGACKIKAEQ